MDPSSLESSQEQVVAAVTDRISRRSASVFGQRGVESCRAHAQAAFKALCEDLVLEKHQVGRTFVSALLDELTTGELTYSDLRSFCHALRKHVREALADKPDTAEQRVFVEAWFFEMLLLMSVRFMAWRDEESQRARAKQGVERLEFQLVQLEDALAEKTNLLEMIREASIPIVPVVRGILVVPLIGTFDALRAELLAESLLSEIARVHARAVIIDISGVPVFDTAAAQMIISLARSVRLLGTRVFMVGMSPNNARTIVQLGIEMDDVRTFSTLRDGLAAALRSQGLKITTI